jgi:hypothetical protein
MAFSINEFITHVSSEKEFAKSDKFEVRIATPVCLNNSDYGFNDGGKFLSLSCESAELPAVDVTPIEFRHYGFVERIPYHLTYSPVNLTFYATGNMKEKMFFDSWIDASIPFNTGLLYYKDGNGIATDVIINQYSSSNNLIYSVTLEDAFPITVSQLSLNWAEDNAHRFQVSLSYKRWNSKNSGNVQITNRSYATNPSSFTPESKYGLSNQLSEVTVTATRLPNPSTPGSTAGASFGGGGGKFAGGGASGEY